MEALHVALSIECLSQPHKSQQYSWSERPVHAERGPAQMPDGGLEA
jgi:hypothetical protein